MARYVGDLTDPDNAEEREDAAALVERVAESIRARKVSDVSVDFDRHVVSGYHDPSLPTRMSSWTVKIQVTQRGRHEQ